MPLWQGLAKAVDNELDSRDLNAMKAGSIGKFTSHQNDAILIAGLVCACFSLVAAFLALRWFILMKRLFRHRLVLFLIASDAFKATWYFIFAVVAFANGPVSTKSGFCQASGFFLLFAVSSADYAILLIAVHTMISIFKPKSKVGAEGGLYPIRNWIYIFWLGPPLLMASLAFINENSAYTTSGTYCYLPKRPFWYRLALSWVPRYLIITTIVIMYLSIYIYVRVKFKSFHNIMVSDSEADTDRTSRHSRIISSHDQTTDTQPIPMPASDQRPRPSALRLHSFHSALGSPKAVGFEQAPWDAMSFITYKALQDTNTTNAVTTEDFAMTGAGSDNSGETEVAPDEGAQPDTRKTSEVPTMDTSYTGDTVATRSTVRTIPETDRRRPNDPLRDTRIAIKRQLRFLFIYPLIYILMWSFPFAYHALTYDDYYVAHPVFWLAIVQTIMLSLQAGVDSIVFSWREKPWRRIDDNSRYSIPFLSQKGKELVTGSRQGSKTRSAPGSFDAEADPTKSNRSSLWWEAEGRKRRDSIWLGTDSGAKTSLKTSQPSSPRPDTIEEA